MGISERKVRQKAELRDAILAAARAIFSRDGMHALTMRRIAEEIEYSPATLYLHFASREAIALELVREGFEKLLAALGPAAAIADPVERLRAIGRAYVGFGLADPQTYKLIFMEDAKFAYAALAPATEPTDDPGVRAFDLIAATIGEAVATGQFTPIDPVGAADAFWAAHHGVLSLAITCPKFIDDVAGIAAIAGDTFIAGLRRY